jgi:hypothetical protein
LHVITEDDIRAHSGGVTGVIRDEIEKGSLGFLLLSMDIELCAPAWGLLRTITRPTMHDLLLLGVSV